MNSKIITLVTIFFISLTSFSQDKNENGLVNISKVTIVNPGISYEMKIAKFHSLYGQFFMNSSISTFSQGPRKNVRFYFDPAFTLQYRYYYNATRRKEKGKLNSLNYIGFIYETFYSKIRLSANHYYIQNARLVNHIGPVWGFQRNYAKRFSLDLNVGAGYLFSTAIVQKSYWETTTKNVGQFTLLGQLNIGFWLNKRK